MLQEEEKRENESTTLDSKMEAILSNTIIRNNHQAHQIAIWILWRLWKSRNVFQERHMSG